MKNKEYLLLAQQFAPDELVNLHQMFIAIAESAKAKGKLDDFSKGPFIKYFTVDLLKQETPELFFVTFFSFMLSQNKKMTEILRTAEIKYIGSVKETDTKSYAVTKLTFNILGG